MTLENSHLTSPELPRLPDLDEKKSENNKELQQSIKLQPESQSESQPQYIKLKIKQEVKEKKNLSFFPLSCMLFSGCCGSMNMGKPMVHSDSLAQEQCCAECACVICFIPAVTVDVISCPFRQIYSCVS